MFALGVGPFVGQVPRETYGVGLGNLFLAQFTFFACSPVVAASSSEKCTVGHITMAMLSLELSDVSDEFLPSPLAAEVRQIPRELKRIKVSDLLFSQFVFPLPQSRASATERRPLHVSPALERCVSQKCCNCIDPSRSVVFNPSRSSKIANPLS
jgi:hypothetical protein